MKIKTSLFQQDPCLAKDVIQQQLKRMGLWKELQQHQAMQAFMKACGLLVSKHVYPERVERGTLFVRVPHSTWVQELTCMKPELLERMKSYQSGTPIKEIKFLVGTVDKPAGWEMDDLGS